MLPQLPSFANITSSISWSSRRVHTNTSPPRLTPPISITASTSSAIGDIRAAIFYEDRLQSLPRQTSDEIEGPATIESLFDCIATDDLDLAHGLSLV